MDDIIVGLDGLNKISRDLSKVAGGTRIWLFYGEMGVGKTTLIQNICSYLGVEDMVYSPTFPIIHEYQSTAYSTIFHFDFYRLKSLDEVYDIGVEEYFESGHYCFVEWPDIIKPIVPNAHVEIIMKHHTSLRRSLRYCLR